MVPALARLERPAALALAALFATLAGYGLWSAPGLVARWGVSPLAVPVLAAWGIAAGWALANGLRTPSRPGWAGFAAMALGVRLAALALTAGRASPGDPHWYGELARHLLAGRGLFVDDPAMGTRVWAEYPPVYPLLLAGWGAMAGLGGAAVLALQTLLDGATAVMIAAVGVRAGADARASRAAAALYLIWPAVVLDAPLAQKESLEVLLVLLLAYGWLGAGGSSRWRAAATVGLPAGLLALTQPGVAAFAALAGLAALPRLGPRRFVAVAAGGTLVAAAVMAPWWWRNARLFGAFVPLTSVGGLSLWVGENQQATGSWMPYPPALTGLPELACARAAGRLAMEWMRLHPLDMLRLNAAKVLRAGGLGQFPLVRLAAMRPAPAPVVAAALLPLVQGAQVALMGGGAAALVLARRAPALTALMAAAVTQLLLFGVWFEFGERHRALLTPLLLLAVAHAAVQLRRRTAPAAASLPARPAVSRPAGRRAPPAASRA